MKVIIEVGDVQYSALSKQLTFKVACNFDAVMLKEESMVGKENPTSQEIAEEMATKLKRCIMSDHTLGGFKIR